MALSRELYQRFIKGQCTEEEELAVLLYFREHPDAMEEHLQGADWEDFTPEGKLHPVVSEKVMDRVQHRITQGARWRQVIRRTAVAAAFTGTAALAWLLLRHHAAPVPQAALVRDTAKPAIFYRDYRNDGATVMQLALEDSSTVQLQPGSSLHYRQGFDSNKRNIWLKGDARFQVAKDSHRPFTVYAATTATTALGTNFRITEDSATHRVTVKLYSGLVKVRPYEHSLAVFAPTYLHPGEKLVFTAGANKLKLYKPTAQQADGDAGTADNALVYRQRPLPAVLKALEQHFNVQIAFNAKALSGVRVTAEFNDTDTPEQILQTIALLNDLTLEGNTANGFTLKR
ncbi:DUF4974 domain-containing protein [Chitinophaga agrisoli]|uniref:DUF4974 domain-containing protein n=1 Tax=Chitinophaga agrisoli TaxID=2607653 RepID=A0A5B2VWY2_9BACT|nr:FecR domain-containing protein [Chitinophaga agrisoli]KAA2242539.1 DUF4974 domain-containing protein [Chitinophaga agrisoli]